VRVLRVELPSSLFRIRMEDELLQQNGIDALLRVSFFLFVHDSDDRRLVSHTKLLLNLLILMGLKLGTRPSLADMLFEYNIIVTYSDIV
jgi:hypothetical protein